MALIDNLVFYCKPATTSGARTDEVAGNDLTEQSGSVGNGSGILTNAIDIERTGNDGFTYVDHADNATFSWGDINASIFFWVKFESDPGTMAMVAKTGDLSDPNNVEYVAFYSSGFFFRVSDGITNTDVSQGTQTPGTWYFVACGHNATANEIWISINAATPATTSVSTGVHDATGRFTVGGDGSGGRIMDGLICEVALFKRDIRADLATFYNGGAALAYPFSGAGGVAAPISQFRQFARVRASNY